MSKGNMKAALKSGMDAELEAAEHKVRSFDRFDKAEAALGAGESAGQNGVQKAGPKVKRDTFTVPPKELTKRLISLRGKAHRLNIDTNKSELIRAGLLLLDQASEEIFLEALQSLEKVKTGRPALEIVKRELQ